jgi:hypothetical protein
LHPWSYGAFIPFREYGGDLQCLRFAVPAVGVADNAARSKQALDQIGRRHLMRHLRKSTFAIARSDPTSRLKFLETHMQKNSRTGSKPRAYRVLNSPCRKERGRGLRVTIDDPRRTVLEALFRHHGNTDLALAPLTVQAELLKMRGTPSSYFTSFLETSSRNKLGNAEL